MTTQLVPVPFHGDTLEAVRQEDGQVLVALRRLCETIGVSFQRQLVKLKARSWATVAQKATVAEDGRRREVTMIDLDTLHGWLVNLNENKVSKEAAPKLVRYQREAVAALRRHFHGDGSPAPPADGDPLLASILATQQFVAGLVEVRQRQLAAERAAADTRAVADRAEALAAAALDAAGNRHGYLSVLAYARLTGRSLPERRAADYGRQAAGRCRADGIVIGNCGSERYGTVNSYPVGVLMAVFGDRHPPPVPR